MVVSGPLSIKICIEMSGVCPWGKLFDPVEKNIKKHATVKHQVITLRVLFLFLTLEIIIKVYANIIYAV